jgi:hypothetical protein
MLDGLLTQVQLRANFFVAGTGGDPFQNLTLALGQFAHTAGPA